MERLCYDCWFAGRVNCLFAEKTEGIANNPELTPQDKHSRIAAERIIAREKRNCSQLNSIDPNYPGKENL